MTYDITNLPNDPEQLKAIIVSLHEQMDKMSVELRRLTRIIEKFFDKSSEKIPKDDSSVPAPESVIADTKRKRNKNGGGGRNPLPPDLSRVENIIDVPENERICTECRMPFKCIGEERSEQLHFKPMELYVVIQILKKYVATCPCSGKRNATAEPPIRADDKGIASNSLLAAIVVQKYADHIPLARQTKQLFKRCGVVLPESNMARWMGLVADLCVPLYELMHDLPLEGHFIQLDATGAKYLDSAIRRDLSFCMIFKHTANVPGRRRFCAIITAISSAMPTRSTIRYSRRKRLRRDNVFQRRWAVGRMRDENFTMREWPCHRLLPFWT